MKTSPLGINFLKSREVFVPNAYLPTPNDKWTYGYGATTKADGTPVKKGDSITEEEADALLALQLVSRENAVDSRISVALTPGKFDCLVSLVYNAGTGYHDKAGKYHDWDLFNNVNEGNLTEAYYTQLAITQAGKVLPGLVNRRKEEWAELWNHV